MMKFMAIEVAALAGGDTLAGRLAGEALRPCLEEEVRRASPGSFLILDFRDVGLVTSSYFVAAFTWLWTSIEVRERELYPVIVNLNEASRDDVEIALRETRIKALTGEFVGGEGLIDVAPENLDDIEKETYRLIEKHGEVSANDLFRMNPRIQVTAWNNRLAALFNYRLLRRHKQGREFIYTLAGR